MSKHSFEREVPDGYRLVKHINATAKLFGIVFNLVTILLSFTVIFSCAVIFRSFVDSPNSIYAFVGISVGGFLSLIYVVLHELLHGIAYKIATGEKLKFGLSWSCAFCGVPSIFVYRKYALLALLLPLVSFTLILLPLMAVCIIFVGGSHSLLATVAYYALSVLLGINIGGSTGDMYVAYLLLFKFKRSDTLIRDIGPEQYIYVRDFV